MSKYAHNVVSDQDKNTPWFKIMRWIGDDSMVLDIGSSSGYFGEKLIKAKGAKVWGIEIDPSDAAAARERGYEAVFEGNLDNFDWSVVGDLRFDAIIYADVLEHVMDPLACVVGAKALLKKGGHIFASIPNVAHITVRVELLEGNFDYEETGLLDNTHIRLFTKKTVLKLFNDAGMNIVHLDSTINDVPDGQVKDHLQKLGLEPGAKFDSVLSSQEARTFQFIVDAEAATAQKPVVPMDKQTAKLHDDWPVIEKKMQDDDRRIKELEEVSNKLQGELTAAQTRLDLIHKHPAKWLAQGTVNRLKNHGKHS